MALLLSILTACSGGAQQAVDWQAYSDQLQRDYGLALNASPSPTESFNQLPRSTELRLEPPRVSVGLLDTLRLDRCRLGQLVARRNSSLGQAQTLHARLLYELDSLLAITECLDSELAENPRIEALLREARDAKHDNLPIYMDQLLTRSDAFRNALKPARFGAQPTQISRDLQQSTVALDYFALLFSNSSFSGDAAGDNSDDSANDKQARERRNQYFSRLYYDLEPYHPHLRHLARSNALPTHWHNTQQTAHWLRYLNAQLADASRSRNCAAAQYFETQLAPVVEQIIASQQQLTPALTTLLQISVQPQWVDYVSQLVGPQSPGGQLPELLAAHRAALGCS